MRLYVGRHSYAGDFSPDPKKERERPLTPEGVTIAKSMAAALATADEVPSVIFASPFARTVQTADIYGKILGVQVNSIDDLSPNRPLEDRILELMTHKQVKGFMIVGHVDNTTPAFNNFGGDVDWDDLVMGEVRRVKIDRKTGAWKLKFQLKPSDIGLKDYPS
jgi:phosphohistidine phosphatase SixA